MSKSRYRLALMSLVIRVAWLLAWPFIGSRRRQIRRNQGAIDLLQEWADEDDAEDKAWLCRWEEWARSQRGASDGPRKEG